MSDERQDATYLGDGLYATHDGYQVELFAHDGIRKTNQVYLSPQTLETFLHWVKRTILPSGPR